MIRRFRRKTIATKSRMLKVFIASPIDALWQWQPPVEQGRVFLHLRDPAPRDENHVAGLNLDVSGEILSLQDFFQVDFLHLNVLTLSSTEQQHLRVFCAW